MLGIKGKASLVMVINEAIQADLIGIASQFYIVEDTSQLVPTAHLTFVDQNGLIIDLMDKLIAGDIRFDFGWPETNESENLFSHRHRLFRINESQQFTAMTASSIALDLVTWSRMAPALTIEDKIRSFGSVSASTIISQLVSEAGGTEKLIESSADERAYIQAQWTDSQFIRHLADHAVSADGTARGFLFFFDRHEQFTFASPKYLYDQNKPEEADDESSLIFANNPEIVAEDASVILAYSFDSDAKSWLSKNGYGTVFSWYDTTDYSYNTETKKLSDDVANFSISDFTMMETEYDALSKGMYTGRKLDDSDNMLRTRYQASMINLNVLIKFDADINLGDVIRIVLPVPDDPSRKESRVMLDTLSSYWVVSRIVHYIDSRTTEYMMKIKLTRTGVSLKESELLVS